MKPDDIVRYLLIIWLLAVGADVIHGLISKGEGHESSPVPTLNR